MSPTQESYDSPTPTPITINAQGMAVPQSATISISNNGGAKINAAKAFNLTFTAPNGCPFQGAVNNVLAVPQGSNNIENLTDGVVTQTYPYSITEQAGELGPPGGDVFDVVVSS